MCHFLFTNTNVFKCKELYHLRRYTLLKGVLLKMAEIDNKTFEELILISIDPSQKVNYDKFRRTWSSVKGRLEDCVSGIVPAYVIDAAKQAYLNASEQERDALLIDENKADDKDKLYHKSIVAKVKQATYDAKTAYEKEHDFLAGQGLRDKEGKPDLKKIGAYGGVLLAACLAVGISARSCSSKVDTEKVIYGNVDTKNWAAASNREQHVKNLAGYVNMLKDMKNMGDAEGVEKSRQVIDDYISTVEKNDPDFKKQDPKIFERYDAQVKSYNGIK